MVSDLYIVQLLLSGTAEPNPNIHWERKPSGAYSTSTGEGLNLKRIEVERVSMRASGDRVIIKFTSRIWGEICVQEPLPKIFSRKNYDSEDDRMLAEKMRELFVAIGDQLYKRTGMLTEDERKHNIFEDLLSELKK